MNIFYPLQKLADWLVYQVLSVMPQTHLADALVFFIYDYLKIIILLAVIIFIVSLIRSFLPPEKVRDILSRNNKYLGYGLAAALGIITPFCSCSAISLFLGFVEVGVPLGITFTFLVSSPMINEVALILLLGTFGWKVALIYVVSGLAIAIIAGLIISKLKAEELVEKFDQGATTGALIGGAPMSWPARFSYARDYTGGIIKQIWFYILLGIGFGAWVHGYVPANFLAQYASADKWYGVLVAVLVGVPLYSNAAGIIPLVAVLTEKGVSLGTSLAFMMAVTALSFPEFVILKRVMKIKLIAIFAGIVTLGIIFTGYLFNFLL